MLKMPYASPLTFSLDIINYSMKFKKYIFSTYVPVKMVKVETRMIMRTLTSYNLGWIFELQVAWAAFKLLL